MEDLSDIFKRALQGLYKKKNDNFGSVNDRVVKMNEERKNNRRDTVFSKRNIPENMSPCSTPAPKREKIAKPTAPLPNLPNPLNLTNHPLPLTNPNSKRLEMLAKWKAEKEKRKLEEKKKLKPIFKVGHVPVSVGLPDLSTVNKEIKGKIFKPSFAPPNHRFKAPSNVKPIEIKKTAPPSASASRRTVSSRVFNNTREVKEIVSKKAAPPSADKAAKAKPLSHKTESTPNIRTRMVTRSQAKSVQEQPPKARKNAPKLSPTKKTAPVAKKATPTKKATTPTKKATSTKKTTPTKKVAHATNKAAPVTIIAAPATTKETPARKATPTKKAINTPKASSARKKSVKGASPYYPIDDTSKTPEVGAGAAPLVTPPAREQPPVYLSPFVTIARGKDSARKEYHARKSGRSFSNEVQSPKAGATYFTWRLDQQIERLQQLCAKWEQYKTDHSPPEEAVSMIDVATGQSNLLISKKFEQFRGLIERCKAQDSEQPVTCEDLHGFWDMVYMQVENLDKRFANLEDLKGRNWEEVVPVPKEKVKKKGKVAKAAKASAGLRAAIEAARRKKLEGGEGNKTPRRSICDVVKAGENGRRVSSPGLTMMKVAQIAKGVETPAKSILKTDSTKSAKSATKVVLFKDDINELENDLNRLNLQSMSTGKKTPTRRSLRLTKNKLF